MKKLLLFRGCTAPVLLPAFEAATIQLLKRFSIKAVVLNDANCCGVQYTEALNPRAHLALSGRILALAEERGLDILPLCSACVRSLKYTKEKLSSDKRARQEVNLLLKEESLSYTGSIMVKHLLEVIRDDIGLAAMKKAITNPYADVRFATHYGCQVVKHARTLNSEVSEPPTIMEDIIRLAGGIAVDYDGKYGCCGGPLSAVDADLASRMGKEKISNIRNAKVQGIVTVCAYCTIQLSHAQFGVKASKNKIPVLTLPQFLVPALGIQDSASRVMAGRISFDRLFESLTITRE
jgi:heterodisulfide reductase subunit B